MKVLNNVILDDYDKELIDSIKDILEDNIKEDTIKLNTMNNIKYISSIKHRITLNKNILHILDIILYYYNK